jgi:hypothetical protein
VQQEPRKLVLWVVLAKDSVLVRGVEIHFDKRLVKIFHENV